MPPLYEQIPYHRDLAPRKRVSTFCPPGTETRWDVKRLGRVEEVFMSAVDRAFH